jgi:hypothetical protein
MLPKRGATTELDNHIPQIQTVPELRRQKGGSTSDDDRRTPTDLSLINRFSDPIQSELLRQRRLDIWNRGSRDWLVKNPCQVGFPAQLQVDVPLYD